MATASPPAADLLAPDPSGSHGRELFFLPAMVGAAFLLRAVYLDARSLWFDETFSVAVARLPWREALQLVGQSDAHPPLYYLLLHLWMGFGDSPAVVRSLSAVFGSLTVVVTYLLGRAIAGRALGVTAGVLVAGSAFAVQSSVEARMGALLALLAVGSTFWLWQATAGRARRVHWVLYGVTLLAALYAHYFAFLSLLGHLVYVLVAHRRQRTIRLGFLLTVGGVVLAYAPWWPVALGQLGSDASAMVWSGRMPPWAPLNIVALTSFGGYLLGLGGFLFGPTRSSWLQALAVLPFLLLSIAGAARLRRPAGILALVCWLVPLMALIAASLASGIFYAVPRQTAFLQPFFALLLAGGIQSLAGRSRSTIPAVALVAAIVIVNLSVLGAAAADPRAQPFDWAGAAQHVETRWRPGDRLVFFPHTARVAFGYYFSLQGAQAVTLYPPPWKSDLSPTQLAAQLPSLPSILGGADRFWLVLSEPTPPGSAEILLMAADRDYRRRAFVDFRRVYVVLYERR